MTNSCALIASPLSPTFQKKFEQLVDEPIRFLPLAELRTKSPYALWKFLRLCRPEKFFLPIEDHNTKVLLPILQLIAKIAAPKQLIVVHPDLNFQKIRLHGIALSFFKFFNTTLVINFFYWLSRSKMNTLLKEPIIECSMQAGFLKKVLYLNANLWFGIKAGGSVGHITGVVNALIKKGLMVDYAAIDRPTLLAKSVNHLRLPNLRGFGIPAVLNYYTFNKTVYDYLSRKNKSDWIFIYQRMSIANFSGVKLSRKLKIPLILEYNGSEVWIAKNWAGRREHYAAIQAEDLCLSQAHIIVTISEVLKQELIARAVPPEKIVCYSNCIDPTLFNPDLFLNEDSVQLRAKYHISPEAVVITFIGTFGQWHGVNILAEVIRTLIIDHEPWLLANKVHFLLVGDGARMFEVKYILGEYIDSCHITLAGLVPQDEAPAYLAASDVLLSPHIANPDGSRFFGSPTKLFEYMAMGKAIIASDLDQIGDVLKNSLRVEQFPLQPPAANNTELGILCEPGNVQQLGKAIQFIVENEAWRDILGNNAREEALAKYTWDHHVNAFVSKFDIYP